MKPIDLSILHLISSLPLFCKAELDHDDLAGKAIKLDGDILLGGLFPIHADGSLENQHCTDHIQKDRGIQRLEAMLFAIDRINADDSLLPGLTLGADIRDTCEMDTHAMEQMMELITPYVLGDDSDTYQCSNGGVPIYQAPDPIAMVIGAASSQVSVMVANMLRLFKIPQISYSATTNELSDRSRFEFFARVVPADVHQVQAMVEVVSALGWDYVHAIADEGQYGDKGVEEFKKQANMRHICVPIIEKIRTKDFTDEDFDAIFNRFDENKHVSGVILWTSERSVKKILRSVSRLNKTGITFLASDNWGRKNSPVSEDPMSAYGAITVAPMSQSVADFNVYYLNRSLSNNKRNVWFDDFYKQVCDSKETNCETWKKDHRQESFVPFVIDAVYTAARALHAYFEDECGHADWKKCSSGMLDGRKLYNYVVNSSFEGINGKTVTVDASGEGMGRYQIYQYLGPDHPDGYIPVGDFFENNLNLSVDKIKATFNGTLPYSKCSLPCKPGEYYIRTTCCWHCLACTGHYKLNNNTDGCEECEEGWYPNENRTECEELPVQKLGFLSVWSILPVSFAVIGLTATIGVTAVFIYFNDTPIVRASGRELCYVILLGIFLSYSVTFLLIASPTITSCTLLRITLGCSQCLCYAAILTKTNRLSRIFRTGAKKGATGAKWISPVSQIVICLSLSSVQLFAAIAWFFVDPPHPTKLIHNRRTVVLFCYETTYTLIIPLAYNACLIVMCTFYAFLTRKIPENFNETKHIGFTMYSTCIVWLAFVPIYFGTNEFRIQITALSTCTSISASVALACFFAPKVYICIFQPHKNVRQHIMTTFRQTQQTFFDQQIRIVQPEKESRTKSTATFFLRTSMKAKLLRTHSHATRNTTRHNHCLTEARAFAADVIEAPHRNRRISRSSTVSGGRVSVKTNMSISSIDEAKTLLLQGGKGLLVLEKVLNNNNVSQPAGINRTLAVKNSTSMDTIASGIQKLEEGRRRSSMISATNIDKVLAEIYEQQATAV